MKLFTRTADRPETVARLTQALTDAQVATRQAQRERDRANDLLKDLVDASGRTAFHEALAAARRHLSREGRL